MTEAPFSEDILVSDIEDEGTPASSLPKGIKRAIASGLFALLFGILLTFCFLNVSKTSYAANTLLLTILYQVVVFSVVLVFTIKNILKQELEKDMAYKMFLYLIYMIVMLTALSHTWQNYQSYSF